MVVLPDEHDSKTWNVMIPDEDGTPVMYKGNQDALKDIMPRPEEVGPCKTLTGRAGRSRDVEGQGNLTRG